MYLESIVRHLFVLCAAIIGLWLVRRRWQRDPEACALVTWGCGLVIWLELAVTAQTAALAQRDWGNTLEKVHQYQLAALISWCIFSSSFAVAVWALVRAALRAIDADRPVTTGLSADDLRSLFPLVRVRHTWFGRRAIVVRPTEIVIGRLNSRCDPESLFDDDAATPFETCTRFDLRPANSGSVQVEVEQVGVIGVARFWRRIRCTSPSQQRTFWVPLNEYPNLRAALDEVLPGGVRERERPRQSVWEILLLLAGVTCFVLNVAMAFTGNGDKVPGEPPTGGGAFTPAPVATFVLVGRFVAWFGPAAVLLAYLVTGVVAMRSRYRPSVPAPRVRRRPASGKPPFRSAVLGWTVKGIGFVYTLLLFGSPAVERAVNSALGKDPDPVVPLAAWALLTLPCVLSMHVGHRLCSRTFTPGSHPDARPPFLFLRAFDDDNRTGLQPNTWLAWFHGITPDFGRRHNRRSVLRMAQHFHPARWFRTFLGLPSDTVEELLAIGTRRVGPLIAIGRPNERSVTSGADRMYVSDANWQGVVQAYLGRSAGVILQPSLTDGVLWEIREVFRRVPRHHVLLSMVNFQGRPDEYERLCLLLRRDHGLSLPRSVPHIDRPCFITLTASGQSTLCPVIYHPTPLWPVTGNAIDIVATLDPYLQGLRGSPAPETAPATKVGVSGALVSVVVTITGVLVLTVGCPKLIEWLLNGMGW